MFLKCALFFFGLASCLAKFPAEVQRCKSGDIDCILQRANEIVRKYPLGWPELGMPAFDPFTIYNFSVSEQPGSAINLQLFLKKAEIRGLSTQNFQRGVGFTTDIKTSKFELYGTIPKLELRGQYTANGRFLLLPIQGDGEFNIVLEKIKGGIKFKPIDVERDGLHYLKLQQVKCLLDPSKIKIQLTNLFNGNEKLGNSINEVLNTNWEDAWAEFGPTILEISGNFIKDTLQTFLDKNAYDDFYLP